MHGGWHSLKPEVFIYFPSQEQSIFDLSFIKGRVVTPRSRKSNTYIYTLRLESSIDLMLLVCLHLFVYIFESDLLIYLLDLSSEIFVDWNDITSYIIFLILRLSRYLYRFHRLFRWFTNQVLNVWKYVCFNVVY
jgi:hypothetical protein